MKNAKNLFILLLFVSLFVACSEEKDINPTGGESPDEILTELKSTIEVHIEGEEALEFEFAECAFQNQQQQRFTNSYGTISESLNIKRLATRLYNRNEAAEVTTELLVQASFVNSVDEGPIDVLQIEQILSENALPVASPSFALELGIRKDGQFFTNINNMFNEIGEVQFNYTSGFEINLKDYEVAYQSDCLEEDLIRIKADFKGTLYKSGFGEIQDSLNVEVEDVELLFMVD